LRRRGARAHLEVGDAQRVHGGAHRAAARPQRRQSPTALLLPVLAFAPPALAVLNAVLSTVPGFFNAVDVARNARQQAVGKGEQRGGGGGGRRRRRGGRRRAAGRPGAGRRRAEDGGGGGAAHRWSGGGGGKSCWRESCFAPEPVGPAAEHQ